MIRLKDIQSIQANGASGTYKVTLNNGKELECGPLRGKLLFTRYANRMMSEFFKELLEDAKAQQRQRERIRAVFSGESASLDLVYINSISRGAVAVQYEASPNLVAKYAGMEPAIEKSMEHMASKPMLAFAKGVALLPLAAALGSAVALAGAPAWVALAAVVGCAAAIALKLPYDKLAGKRHMHKALDFLSELGVSTKCQVDGKPPLVGGAAAALPQAPKGHAVQWLRQAEQNEEIVGALAPKKRVA